MTLGQLCFGFQGRIRRLQFWGASLLVTALVVLLAFVMSVWFPTWSSIRQDPVAIALIAIMIFLLFWAGMALAVKRWHDRDKSSLWMLLPFIPIIGPIWALIETGFLDGSQGPNRFGPSPKGIGEVGPVDDPPAIYGSDPTVPLSVLASVVLSGALSFAQLEHLASHRPVTASETPMPRTIAKESSGGAAIGSLQVPALRGRVNDNADLLTPAQETELETLYRSLEQEMGCQIALLTIGTLHGVRIEDYSLRVANTWGLGRRGIDDGVLITMAVADRTVRIEVGSGLESVIPNDAAKKIIDEHMVPAFKKGNSFQGLKDGSQEIVQRIRANPTLVGKRTSAPDAREVWK